MGSTRQSRYRQILRCKIAVPPPNLPDPPRTSLHDNRHFRFGIIFNLAYRRLSCREVFWVDWEVRGGIACGFALVWWMGCVWRVYAFCKCRLIPPHQSLTRQLPPKGKPFCKISFALHDKATRANRKGKPQLKDIFDISAMYATFAVFAQCKKGFPLGGKLSRKRLMRGDKSALSIGCIFPPKRNDTWVVPYNVTSLADYVLAGS